MIYYRVVKACQSHPTVANNLMIGKWLIDLMGRGFTTSEIGEIFTGLKTYKQKQPLTSNLIDEFIEKVYGRQTPNHKRSHRASKMSSQLPLLVTYGKKNRSCKTKRENSISGKGYFISSKTIRRSKAKAKVKANGI